MAILNNLIVNGAARFLNKTYFDTISANTIDANEGIFKKLVAKNSTLTDVTVVGLMDVTGELHTKSFTNSNIATIDGSFYITPTLGLQGANTTTNTVTVTANSLSFANASGTSFSFESLYLEDTTSPVAWSTGSSVIVTGEIQDKTTGEWMPLGTLKGTLSTYSTTSVVINSIKDSANGTAPATLAAIVASGTTSGLKYRNIKVSLVSINRSGLKPLGIFMTATGSNGRTFLDIYGGNNAEANTYGGLSTPVLRIGNLNGLPALTLPNNTSVAPAGWGIYTTNGFFSGTIVSTQGKIGNFTLGTAIYGATSGSGPSTISATTAGTYLGTDGFRNNNSSDTTKYAQITNGILTAQGAIIQGTLTAGAGSSIGPWTITANSIYKGNATYGTSGSGNMYFGDDGLSISNIFKVSNAGVLNATGAILKSLTIQDSSGNTVGTFASDIILGQTSGNKYNINIDSSGINFKYNTNILNKIDSSGMTLYDGNGVADSNILANFNTSGAQIGQSGGAHSVIDANGQRFYASNGSTQLANIGYGEGAAQDGTAIAPYYTFGIRASGSTIGNYSVAEGRETIARGYTCHAEGLSSLAGGYASHAEGYHTRAIGTGAHAEGNYTTTEASYSHAEGYYSQANADKSHAEGHSTVAGGIGAHAEGYMSVAGDDYSHAQNIWTKAYGKAQTVLGTYNIIEPDPRDPPVTTHPSGDTDYGTLAVIIGNGTADNARSNALTVDWNGSVNIASGAKYKINGTNLAASDVGAVADCTLSLYNGAGGNPGVAKFCTVNYTGTDSNNGVLFKTTFMAGHGNGSSYNHLQDCIISVNYQGAVSVDIYRYYAQSVTYASTTHYYGDVLYTVDTTNKIVTFYTLMGQYSTTKFSPYKRLNASSAGTITQHTGTATMGASGTTTFANVYWLNGTNLPYLPLSGGTMNGPIGTNTNSLPQFSGAPAYLVGIEAFADGGTMKWQSASSVNVGYATSAGSASSAASLTGTLPVNQLTWAGGVNLTPTASANGQEWSIDLNPGSYTGCYWHVWSSKNSKSILCCYPDNNEVTIPNGPLTVNGTTTIGGVTRINNSLYSDILYTGSGVVNGNLSVGGTLYQSSDRRLKKHLNYLGKDAITFIQNLKPAHYIKDEKEYVGFYAQDVDKIDYWGTMTEINKDNYYSLNYSEIIAPLVTYCHYLEERIKKLEER